MSVERELVSSCCSAYVQDLAGDGVGGLDICPACGEWAEIIDLNEGEFSKTNLEEEIKQNESTNKQ